MEKGKGENLVYIVECADGTLYTGWTNHLSRRMLAHNEGRGAKYTRGRLPVRLVYWEAQPSKEAALRREHAIKRLSRKEKFRLIAAASQLTLGQRDEI